MDAFREDLKGSEFAKLERAFLRAKKKIEDEKEKEKVLVQSIDKDLKPQDLNKFF